MADPNDGKFGMLLSGYARPWDNPMVQLQSLETQQRETRGETPQAANAATEETSSTANSTTEAATPEPEAD